MLGLPSTSMSATTCNMRYHWRPAICSRSMLQVVSQAGCCCAPHAHPATTLGAAMARHSPAPPPSPPPPQALEKQASEVARLQAQEAALRQAEQEHLAHANEADSRFSACQAAYNKVCSERSAMEHWYLQQQHMLLGFKGQLEQQLRNLGHVPCTDTPMSDMQHMGMPMMPPHPHQVGRGRGWCEGPAGLLLVL